MKDNVILSKTEDFAVRVINLYKYLYYKKHESVISKQLLRSGTSIGANMNESQCAQSDADFLSKSSIAFKECNESLYWLRLLYRTQYLSEEEYKSMYSDGEEIYKILTKIIRATKNKIEINKSVKK